MPCFNSPYFANILLEECLHIFRSFSAWLVTSHMPLECQWMASLAGQTYWLCDRTGCIVSTVFVIGQGILCQLQKQVTGPILSLRPAIERRHYRIMPNLIGWTQTKNQPWVRLWQGQVSLLNHLCQLYQHGRITQPLWSYQDRVTKKQNHFQNTNIFWINLVFSTAVPWNDAKSSSMCDKYCWVLIHLSKTTQYWKVMSQSEN